LKYPPEIKN